MNDLQLTQTSLALISVSVGAIAAILGHVTAGLLNLAREFYMDQRKVRRAEAAAAIEAVVALESVMATCHNIVKFERLIVAPDDMLNVSFECELPSTDMINSIAYRDLESNIALEVAKIKSDLHAAVNYLSSLDLAPPHYGNAVYERRQAFATIGARISMVLNKIVNANQMAGLIRSDQYDPNRDFKEALEEMLSSHDQSDVEHHKESRVKHA